MTLVEWLSERRRRGIGGDFSDPFHRQLKDFGDADYDALLAAAVENRKEAGLVCWALWQRPPQNQHRSLWFCFGGHAKRAILSRLSGEDTGSTAFGKLMSLPMDELRVALRSPVLEEVARQVSGEHFRSLETLIAEAAAGGEDGSH